MRLGDGLGDGDTDGHLDTVGDRHAGGDLDCPHSLHWHLSALTVNLLLARSGGGGDNTNSRGSRDENRGSRVSAEWSIRRNKEDLSVSIGLGFSISLALFEPTATSSHGSIKVGGNSRDSSEDWLDGDLLGADLGDDVLALGGEGGLGHSPGLSGALLGLSALLLCGALLLSDGPLHVLALGLSGALGLVTAHLIRHGLAHLLGHLLHDVGALLLGGGGALLLGHIPGHGGALLLGVGGALLPGLSPGLCHSGIGAHALSDGRAGLST